MKEKKDHVSFIQFSHLLNHPDLWHGIFSRHGGTSEYPYKSLNVSFGLGDKDSRVIENRSIINKHIGGYPVLYASQNHGTEILVFQKEDESGIPIALDVPLIGDALVTDIPGMFLGIQVADCQSVLLYDANRQVVANIHSGWRGSICNIIGRTVGAMAQGFQSQPVDILAGIGPSLGPCCAEFINYRQEIPKHLWKYRNPKNLFDFWAISHDQLTAAGISTQNIVQRRICTKCSTERFFSYRGEGTTGRFASVIGITP